MTTTQDLISFVRTRSIFFLSFFLLLKKNVRVLRKFLPHIINTADKMINAYFYQQTQMIITLAHQEKKKNPKLKNSRLPLAQSKCFFLFVYVGNETHMFATVFSKIFIVRFFFFGFAFIFLLYYSLNLYVFINITYMPLCHRYVGTYTYVL